MLENIETDLPLENFSADEASWSAGRNSRKR